MNDSPKSVETNSNPGFLRDRGSNPERQRGVLLIQGHTLNLFWKKYTKISGAEKCG